MKASLRPGADFPKTDFEQARMHASAGAHLLDRASVSRADFVIIRATHAARFSLVYEHFIWRGFPTICSAVNVPFGILRFLSVFQSLLDGTEIARQVRASNVQEP